MIVLLAPRQTVRMGAAFGLVAAGTLGAVAASGGWEEFVYQCFTGKVTYLARAGLSYFEEMHWTPRGLLYLAPVCLAVLAWQRRHGRVLCLGMVSLAAVYPRPDSMHMLMGRRAWLWG
jgi:hypothetical protein